MAFFPERDRKRIMKVLDAAEIETINLTIIFNSADSVKQWKKDLTSPKLLMYIKHILYHEIVEAKSMNVENHDLAKLLGIHSFVFNSCSNYGIVTKDTEVVVDSTMSLGRYKQLNVERTKLGGLDSTLKELRELILLSTKCSESFKDVGMKPPRGILLQGPAGCGKTSIVKQIGQEVNAFVLVVNGPELLGSRPGETVENLTNAFRRAQSHSEEGPCILFFDEIDSLCGSSERAEDARIVGSLCTLMDDVTDLAVVGATNRPDAVHRSLRRPGRFDREVFIGIPTVGVRREILQTLTRTLPLSRDVDLSHVAAVTRGYVGADLAQLCREAAYNTLTNGQGSEVTMADFQSALHTVCPSTQRGSQARVDFRPVLWDQIGGLEAVKAQIRQAVEWPITHPEAFARLGLTPPRGVLLYGPPGCGKTTLVRAAATSCHATFLSVTGAQIFSPYVGEAERIIAQVFHEARMGAPSILFMDELDSILGSRASSHSGVQERVLSTLLNLLDGVGVKMAERTRTDKVREGDDVTRGDTRGDARGHTDHGSPPHEDESPPHVVIVGATNRPDMIDGALIRPGRMDRIIYVPPPDVQTRRQILTVLTSRMPLSSDVDLDRLAELTECFTGADLESLCNEAGLLALTLSDLSCEQIDMAHFTSALDKMSPSNSPQQLEQYENCLR